MTLTDKINEDIKAAMKAKDKAKLEALRAIKSALLVSATEKGGGDNSEEAGMKLLQKLVKQRKDAAAIFHKEGRTDLAEPEEEQIKVIEAYLPKPLTEEEVKVIVEDVVNSTGASSLADMGKVMGMVNQKTAGRADGKMVADLVKAKLG